MVHNEINPNTVCGRIKYKGIKMLKIHDSFDNLQSTANHRKKVAVIGSGISGLAAAWHLQYDCDVEIFESEEQIGGHSHTVKHMDEYGDHWIDMGFIVFNRPCYPNLVALFEALDVKHELADMSFGVSARGGNYEYSSLGVDGIIAQKSNLLSPRFYGMIFDIIRFNKNALSDFAKGKNLELSLGEYLQKGKYGKTFIEDHLLPQAAAIWSCTADKISEYPFASFVRFFSNHGLLQLKDRVLWRSVVGGAQTYLKKIATDFNGKIHVSCPIKNVIRHDNKVELFGMENSLGIYDDVIFATHTDVTAKIFNDAATSLEKEIIGTIKYSKNRVILHKDVNLMPKRRKAWAAWNYISNTKGLCVSYWMNILQRLETKQEYFVTLNPSIEIAPEKIIAERIFDHPIFDADALNAQRRIGEIQGVKNFWYCGAWQGYGFHEDGLQSGLAVAEAISGRKRPWDFDNSQNRLAYQMPHMVQNA